MVNTRCPLEIQSLCSRSEKHILCGRGTVIVKPQECGCHIYMCTYSTSHGTCLPSKLWYSEGLGKANLRVKLAADATSVI